MELSLLVWWLPQWPQTRPATAIGRLKNARGPCEVASRARFAAETTAEMQRLRNTAAGPIIGKVVLTETGEGVAPAAQPRRTAPGPEPAFLARGRRLHRPKGELPTNLARVNITTPRTV